MWQKILIPLFSFIWRKRLFYWGRKVKVVSVKGWRSCIIDTTSGDRQRWNFMFKIMGDYK